MVQREERRIDVPDLKRKAFETRIIVLAHGIDFHIEDISDWSQGLEKRFSGKNTKTAKHYRKYDKPYLDPPFEFLRKKFGSSFKVDEDSAKIKKILREHKLDGFESVRKVGGYTSDKQKVKFVIVCVVSKKDFKRALETEKPKLHVIYDGHSRYGRGACFSTYTGSVAKHQQGNQWGMGNGDDSGLFRLAYPYVAVPIEDIHHHKYFFAPVPVEEGVPSNEKGHPFNRHPHARKALKKITLPLELRHLVYPPTYESRSNQYYGLTRSGKTHLLLNAGWTKSLNAPYDLGAADMKCKVFCHFGCSSRLHFWHIVRIKEYKGWERPKPPTDKYAYFTTAPSDSKLTPLWLYYLLAYKRKNNYEYWWKSLEWAKKRANKKFRRIKAAFQIY